jgi:hypothetical protein
LWLLVGSGLEGLIDQRVDLGDRRRRVNLVGCGFAFGTADLITQARHRSGPGHPR